MANFYNFSSDTINIFGLVIDMSGSMGRHEKDVVDGLELYKKSFEGFSEANSIAVSVSMFNDDFYPADFKRVSEFNINYSADGCTALYYSIVKGANHLSDYIKEVTERTGCIPRATFIFFSDGEPTCDKMDELHAKDAIKNLNYAGVTTVFVAFGEAMTSEFGKNLGFVCTKDAKDLTNFLGVELSKSCKEQSKSLKALGANFFSQAANNGNSEAFSHTTAQALGNPNWYDDI